MAEMVPCLMLPPNETSYDIKYFHGEGEFCKVGDFEIQTQLCKGWSQKRLITLGNDSSMHVINPLSRGSSSIKLPAIHTFPDVLEYRPERLKKEYLVYMGDDHCKQMRSSTWMRQVFIKKVILSSTPFDGFDRNCIAIAIHNSNKLAYCIFGDQKWKTVEASCSCLHDIIHFEDKFYLVDEYGNGFFVLDVDLKKGSFPKLRSLTVLPPKDFGLSKGTIYLVVLNGELVMVDRDRDLSLESYKTNESFCMKSCDKNCLPGNCIYFTDDYTDGHFSEKKRETTGSDLGVFDLRDCSIRPFRLPLIYKTRGNEIWPLPIWIQSHWGGIQYIVEKYEKKKTLEPATPISQKKLATLDSLEKRLAGIGQKIDTEIADIKGKMDAMMKKIDGVLQTKIPQ